MVSTALITRIEAAQGRISQQRSKSSRNGSQKLARRGIAFLTMGGMGP